jgi:hypothetical protein
MAAAAEAARRDHPGRAAMAGMARGHRPAVSMEAAEAAQTAALPQMEAPGPHMAATAVQEVAGRAAAWATKDLGSAAMEL